MTNFSIENLGKLPQVMNKSIYITSMFLREFELYQTNNSLSTKMNTSIERQTEEIAFGIDILIAFFLKLCVSLVVGFSFGQHVVGPILRPVFCVAVFYLAFLAGGDTYVRTAHNYPRMHQDYLRYCHIYGVLLGKVRFLYDYALIRFVVNITCLLLTCASLIFACCMFCCKEIIHEILLLLEPFGRFPRYLVSLYFHLFDLVGEAMFTLAGSIDTLLTELGFQLRVRYAVILAVFTLQLFMIGVAFEVLFDLIL